MEIKINIPANDYVQQTEVREDVVQMICDYILDQMKIGMWVEDTYDITLHHKDWNYQLYLNLRNDNSIYGFGFEYKPKMNQIRIRTTEMQAVFNALQNAGYHIFGWAVITGERKYAFTKKPVYDNRKATRLEFTEFID